MIDLHLHTTSSDGSDEPIEILKKAQHMGLKYIAITDHDSIGAYDKLKETKINSYFSGRLITGCEFSVVHDGKQIEVLGYGMDLEAIESFGVVSDEKFLERENSYLRKLTDVCTTLGIKFTPGLSISGKKYFSTQVLHADLKKYPENEAILNTENFNNLNTFYRSCVCNENSPFYINQKKDFPTVSEAADLIHKAEGKAFLAHLYGYYADDHIKLLDSIVSLNALDGIECYHSLHTMDKTDLLLEYCKTHNIYSSGGSDYHGKLKPNVKLGECQPGVTIPMNMLIPWLDGLHEFR